MCSFGAFVPRGCIFIFIVFYCIGSLQGLHLFTVHLGEWFLASNAVFLSSDELTGGRAGQPAGICIRSLESRITEFTGSRIVLFRKGSSRFTGTFDWNWLSRLKECDDRFWWEVLGVLGMSKMKRREYMSFSPESIPDICNGAIHYIYPCSTRRISTKVVRLQTWSVSLMDHW
jgi:hypothetical protein